MNKYIKLRLTKPKTNRDSKIKVVNRDKFKDIKPTRRINNFETVRWLKSHCSRNHLKQSVLSLLPNNGEPIENEDDSPETKQRNKIKKWLSTYCKSRDMYDLDINPKYLFNEQTFKKDIKTKTDYS